MRVLVCGGRDYRDAVRFRNEMSRIHSKLGISHLIHGDALGADRLADAWALMCGIPVTAYPANWYPDGKDGGRDDKAGPKRNAKMLAEGRPDLVVAFPGWSGTNDMVERARAAGVRVMEIER
ncbi:MAG: hypothetical protein DI537_20400 [Stutzerimonas stutzeri]|nr:MAG: hypothetical protein DI537_20400 [Stutzerimonas stutzeri]